MKKHLLKNDLTTFLLRIAILYVALVICRVVFFLLNSPSFGDISMVEIPKIIWGSFLFDSASIFYVNSIFLLFSLLPLRMREKRWYQDGLFYIYMVINTIIILLNLSDAIYYRYVSKRFTAEEFYFTQNDNTGDVILKTLLEYWYLAVLFVLMVWALSWYYKYIVPYHKSTFRKYYLTNAIILLLMSVVTVAAIRGGLRGVRPLTINQSNLYVNSTKKAALVLSNPFCVIRTLGYKNFQPRVFMDDAIVDSLYTPLHYPKDLKYNLKGRNVVFFTLESFSRENSAFLNSDFFKEGEEGYMPFLDSLMRRSYVFTDAFMSGHRRSIDALPANLASIPSPYQSFILLPQAMSTINGLPKILADLGYSTSFFNGSERGSMGFDSFVKQIGVKNVYTREDFEKEWGYDEFDGTWGIWDEPFLQYMAQKIDKEKEPFFASVFTISSHHPFKTPEIYDSVLPKGKTVIQRPVAYTDYSLRRFFDYAKSRPWFNNTIFVFASDHCATENNDPRTNYPPLNTQIVMFIYTPDEAVKGYDTRTAQQVDLMPTLLGILGNEKPYFAFGTDVINEPKRERGVVNVIHDLCYFTTDSLVLIYNDEKDIVNGVFRRDDPFRKVNVYDPKSSVHRDMQTYIKAYIQCYGRHITKMDYVNSGR
ncbi:MAG: LTA synthase family protein [Rikenellaceae bacterium]